MTGQPVTGDAIQLRWLKCNYGNKCGHDEENGACRAVHYGERSS